MKKLFNCIILLLIFSHSAKSQEWYNSNVIIIVNDEVNLGSTSLKISYYTKDKALHNIEANYIPGKLKINKEDYERLVNESIGSLQVEVKYAQICNDNVSYTYYNIEDFKIQWLADEFYILRLYDTSLKRYKKIYDSLPNKSYTYEYDSPSGSMRRVQKKLRKIDNCP